MTLSLIAIGLRVVILLVASVVLGLSASMAQYQAVDIVPVETGFAASVGAFGLFVSIVGLIALWYDRIDPRVMMYLDLCTAFLNLLAALGLTFALQTVSSCTATDPASEYKRVTNDILSGGCVGAGKDLVCSHAHGPDGKDLTPARCMIARTDYVFLYVGFIFASAMLSLGYILLRQGRGGTPPPTGAYN
ncbi:hypothetical protein F5Y07DRAFT_408962 [Xylaria sp. FL0933]|nr:hypothetical protein F5Y07DRAFT_408962 [Xylaria sp. FL0933]